MATTKNHSSLSVREMLLKDIPEIVKYWLHSSPAHLTGMGVDLNKLPTEEKLSHSIAEQITLPLKEKGSYGLIWLYNTMPIGHCNVNQINFGEQAYMHLHLWKNLNRQKGLGTEFVRKSIPIFFEKLQLKRLFCEPYALNDSPNKTLAKLDFSFVKQHITIPGNLNFPQMVNLWQFNKEQLIDL